MKKQITLLFTLIVATLTFIACNNDDNGNGGTNPVVGTWKLVEKYTNGNTVSLNSCEMEETYIFGPEQFTHELYISGGKTAPNAKSALGGDDDDDDDDHHGSSDDDDDDHHGGGTTTPTDDSSDDDSDDDHGTGGSGGSGNCVNSERVIGYWTAQNNQYTLTSGSSTEVKTIVFTDANNRFYIEVTSTVNGTQVTTRYVYQKQ